jgi:hypothetical protein
LAEGLPVADVLLLDEPEPVAVGVTVAAPLVVAVADEDDDSDEGDDGEGDGEPAEDSGGGNKVRLKAWSQRRGKSMGYEAPEGRPVPLIDRIHRVMHLWKEGDVHKVDDYLDEHALRRNELFKRVVQALIELSAGSERSLLDSAALDAVDAEVMALIDRSVAAARSAAPPTAADLLTDVYVSY